MATPLILLPPSEGKAGGGTGPPWADAPQSFPDLAVHRRKVIAALVDAMAGPVEARSQILGVGAAKADEAAAANRSVDSAPTLPAIQRYTGVLYDALDYPALSATVGFQAAVCSLGRRSQTVPDAAPARASLRSGFQKRAGFPNPGSVAPIFSL